MSEALGRTLKILVGKPGLDGHSNGAEQIAVRARDAGMDVVYEGIRLTPAQIARSAIDEGVHVIGLSILSGSHRELIPDVIAALDGADIPVVVGGIIPDADVPELRAAGVAAVYTPKDFELDRIMHDIVALVAERNAVTGLSSARGSRAGDRTAAPAALNLLETRTAREQAAALVSAAGDGAGHVVGVTGPPGVGKSTLLSALLREWRRAGARSPCSPSTRPPSAPAARCSATARGSSTTPPTATSSSARWPRASGSAASPRRPAPPRRRSRTRSTSS